MAPKVLQYLWIAISRLYLSAINNHGNPFYLVLNFCLNFSPIFIWLSIFKNAGIIPHGWRPTIHVKIVYYIDLYFFEISIIGIICGIATLVLSYFMYLWVFQSKNAVRGHRRRRRGEGTDDFIPLSTFEQHHHHDDTIDDNIFEVNDDEDDDTENGSYQDSHIGHQSQQSKNRFDESSSSSTENEQKPYDEEEEEEEDSDEIAVDVENGIVIGPESRFNPSLPPGYSPIFIVLLLGLSWPILNIDYYLAQPEFITSARDIFSWVLYVLCHLIVPIVTAVYLYVFQPPGAVKYFSIILGCQNIAGVITHLLFPNAPPWFIHLNGLDITPDYDMPGYAAGLTRVDVAMGTHLNSKGFHKSPIVFGAFPSLHSAMAVQTFLHLNYYSRWWVVKLAGLSFVVIQWWATIYLDHHFRLDLLCGLIYAYVSFIIFQKTKLPAVYERFYNGYWFDQSLAGTNMGMRVFNNTPLKKFFDPYS
ncbi:inositolphosphotransferase [Saccharomycopsis crataegensis]|uniref:Inositolphosphotransferase n=1 Tax=Saccharomycopsis crataegensis TaxID=43959 RepID=A0AAV5QH98_9ASCO|nr:inositolphosphotransferase [Saccharomycopsis crataegensis]